MADGARLGRYQIVREIARSNDIVHEAVDPLLGRRVALKELLVPPNLDGSARRERVERFYREARAAGALAHANIVTIFEVGEDEGRHFIAMEYLEGQTLRSALDALGGAPLPLSETISTLDQVLDALAYAHANGVVHRDIKPDNIFLLNDGSVKLTDFGIARIMEEPSLTGDGQVFGTPSYMSPEQISGKPTDERTDLYSTGVMAYEMVAGRKPFAGDNVVALTYQIMSVDPESPRGISEPLAEFLRTAMARDPAARFQTAARMAEALHEAASGSGAAGSVPAPSAGGQAAGSVGPQTIFPTLPPVRRARLSNGARQFLASLALGLVIGCALIGMGLGVRSSYSNYKRDMIEQAAAAEYNAALDAYKAGRFEDAATRFASVARRARGTRLAGQATQAAVLSNLNLGDAEASRGGLESGLTYYRQASALDPKSAEPHLRMGDVLGRMRRFDEAEKEWRRAIEVDAFGPAATQARTNLATLYYNRAVDEFNANRVDDARRDWQSAIDIDPNGPLRDRAAEMVRRSSPSPFGG